jgi:hypothetical protein
VDTFKPPKYITSLIAAINGCFESRCPAVAAIGAIRPGWNLHDRLLAEIYQATALT